MARSTPRERRRRTLRIGLAAGALALTVAGGFTLTRVDPDTAHALGQLARNSTVHVALVGIGLAVVAISEILDNADKLKLLRELLYRALGYSDKDIEQRNRDFGRIPDDYEHRQELERDVARVIGAGVTATGPRLIVLRGERDTGKTTLINFVGSRSLVKRYRGRVLLCRGDPQSIEAGPGDTEERIREKLVRRIFTRIIDQTPVPGDPGDSLKGMKKAIADYFQEERRPWLVVVDQIDDARFPYERVLPTLYGARNTVVVACRYPTIPESALRPLDPTATVERTSIGMRPFTQQQALNLLKAELRKRHARPSALVLEPLLPYLDGASPGVIQRVSDALGYPDSRQHITEMGRTLGAVANDEARVSALAALTVSRFAEAELRYLVALSVLRRDNISVMLLRYLERRIGSPSGDSASLLEWCVERGYIKVDDEARADGVSVYRISKLGQGMARAARLRAGIEAELQAGAAILDYYRALATGRTAGVLAPARLRVRGLPLVGGRRRAGDAVRAGADLLAELPNLLQAMAWSQTPPRMMPRSDVIVFARVLRRAFYHSGEWRAGMQWLTYAALLAGKDDLPCSAGDLESATAQLLLGRGLPGPARQHIAAARSAYQRSEAQARADIRLRLSPRQQAVLADSVQYNMLQILWLTHLDVQSSLALLPSSPAIAALEGIGARLHEARAALRALAQDAANRYQTLARSVELTLLLDEGDLALRLGDAFVRYGDSARGRHWWRHARQLATTARRLVPSAGRLTGMEGLPRAYRLEGAALRRHARYASFLLRPFWRRAAIHYLRRGLRSCLRIPSHYEQALTLHQSALVAIASPSTDHRLGSTIGEQTELGGWLRYVSARLRPRWHRLHAAMRQLRSAAAAAATMGAEDVHVRILVTLAQSSLLAWHLDHAAIHLAAAREHATSVHSIVSRLHERAPELERYLEALPEGLRAELPAHATLLDRASADELVAVSR